MSYDLAKIRADFPILTRRIGDRPLIYLDNGASAQKPRVVIETVRRFYEHSYANVHRGLHTLSTEATEAYEAVRGKLRRFLNAGSEEEVLFTTGTTQGLNLVSYAWGAANLKPGDEILLSVMEHHANIVPWHFLRERQGIVLRWVAPEADGSLPADKILAAITSRTRMIALSHMSNVLGTVVDAGAVCQAARRLGIVTVIDGSQAAVHRPVDVQALGCDFYAVTGHKLYGPTASGALYVRRALYAEMRPFLGGGDMIRTVTREAITWNDPPHKFEAGTPGIAQMIGLGAALDYLTALGMDRIAAHEAALARHVAERLGGLNWLNVQGRAAGKGAIFSFTMAGGAHPHDISTIVDQQGVAVRAGHHCAQPLMDHLGLTATCRASFGLYNTVEEADALIAALEKARSIFG